MVHESSPLSELLMAAGNFTEVINDSSFSGNHKAQFPLDVKIHWNPLAESSVKIQGIGLLKGWLVEGVAKGFTQLSRESLLNQKMVGTYIAQSQGQNTGFCDQKMNLDFKPPVNLVVPGFGGWCESEQSTADSQMKWREYYPIDHVKMENGFLLKIAILEMNL